MARGPGGRARHRPGLRGGGDRGDQPDRAVPGRPGAAGGAALRPPRRPSSTPASRCWWWCCSCTSRRGLVLVAVLVPILGLAYRGYVALVTRHARLELLYRFVGSTGDTAGSRRPRRRGAERGGRACCARPRPSCWCSPTAEEPGSRSVLRVGAVTRPSCRPRPRRTQWWSPALTGSPCCCGPPRRRPARRGARAPRLGDHRDGIAVHVAISAEVRAVLLVLDRTFEQETFGTEDLRLLETLAAHAAVTLDKARLDRPAAPARRAARPRGTATTPSPGCPTDARSSSRCQDAVAAGPTRRRPAPRPRRLQGRQRHARTQRRGRPDHGDRHPAARLPPRGRSPGWGRRVRRPAAGTLGRGAPRHAPTAPQSSAPVPLDESADRHRQHRRRGAARRPRQGRATR